jgi:DNA-binding MltR family transcriptional regulator
MTSDSEHKTGVAMQVSEEHLARVFEAFDKANEWVVDGKGYLEDLIAVLKVTDQQNDIRLVITLSVGFIEQHLDNLIIAHLRGYDKPRHKQFMRGALNSVSKKVSLASALGAIPPSAHDILDVLIGVRNRFAHHPRARDVTDPEIVKLLAKLDSKWKWPFGSDKISVEAPADELTLRVLAKTMIMALNQTLGLGDIFKP